jgi:IS5 family transposase
MQPTKIDNRQEDIFRGRLSNELNPKHEMMVLSRLIPWDSLEVEFADLYQSVRNVGGQPPKPIRLMIGILLLQHLHNLSDEQVVRGWVENPYWQFFCGYDFLQWNFPIDPSSLTRFRNRIGANRMEKILSLTVSVAVESKAVKVKDLKKVNIDTTVMPKNIEFPTDSKLYDKARKRLVKLASKYEIELRQNYNLIAKTLLRKISGYLHAKQMKRARKAIKHLRTIVGRVVRDVERKISDSNQKNFSQENSRNSKDLSEIFTPILNQTKRLLAQQRKDKNKLYSLHEPDVACISKGKAHKRYEFGCKVSITTTHKQGLVISSEALPGNPYDGHTLKPALESSERITGVEIDSACVDRGYKGHGVESDPFRNHTKIFISGQRRGLTKSLKKQLKRRSAIEPMIGHMKQEGKLGLCRLKGIVGDQINALLTGVGHNLRLILNHIRKLLRRKKLKNFLRQFLFRLLEIFLLKIYRLRSC